MSLNTFRNRVVPRGTTEIVKIPTGQNWMIMLVSFWEVAKMKLNGLIAAALEKEYKKDHNVAGFQR